VGRLLTKSPVMAVSIIKLYLQPVDVFVCLYSNSRKCFAFGDNAVRSKG